MHNHTLYYTAFAIFAATVSFILFIYLFRNRSNSPGQIPNHADSIGARQGLDTGT